MRDLKVVILGDTHIRSSDKLPEEIKREIEKSDWIIHTGDYVSEVVLEELIKLKGDFFIGVFGNADPQGIRKKLPEKKIFDLNNMKFGLTHPAIGGPEEKVESFILRKFNQKEIKILIYGHTHKSKIEKRGNLLLLNPGKGYIEKSYFGPPTSYILLFLDKNGNIKLDLKYVNKEIVSKEFFFEKF